MISEIPFAFHTDTDAHPWVKLAFPSKVRLYVAAEKPTNLYLSNASLWRMELPPPTPAPSPTPNPKSNQTPKKP
jgi:hypothetical protein